MKILVTEVQEDWQQDLLKQALSDHTLIFTSNTEFPASLAQNTDTDVLCVFVGTKVTAEHINALSQLKLITTRSTGFDHIDLAAAKAKGIPVASVPFYGENTVAEHTMALLLALSRRLRPSFDRTRAGRVDYEGLRGWDLKGKTLGLIGGGHIGMHVARMARGFEMEVQVFDLKQDPNLAQTIGFSYVPMEQLLQNAHAISMHLPLNDHTKHILSTPQFEMMRQGVYIVNTARGGLIDTAALLQALKSGKVAGAGLDVLEQEEFLKEEAELIGASEVSDKMTNLLADHVLMDMENVLVTPHNAFNSIEALERILHTTVENIQSFVKGTPQNIVS